MAKRVSQQKRSGKQPKRTLPQRSRRRQYEHPKPYFLELTSPGDLARKIKLKSVDVPLSRSTLGDLGLATEVTGPDEFSPVILVQPYDPGALTGIDAVSVHVFWWDEKSGSLRPVWKSGINLGLGFVWTEIQHPGVYVPIGLPRDRFLQEMVRAMARERKYLDPGSYEAGQALVKQVIAPVLETPEAELELLRQQLALLEVQTGNGLVDPREVRLGQDGAIAPYPLPGDAGIQELKDRLAGLEIPLEGLPEEALVYAPEIFRDPSPPWQLPGGGWIPDPEPEPLPWPIPLPFPPRWPRPWPPIDWEIFLPPLLRLPFFRFCWFFSPNWWMHHHDEQHSGAASGCSNIRSTSVHRLHLHVPPIALAGPIISIPSVVDGKIYVGTATSSLVTSGGTLYKIDLLTGNVDATFSFSGIGSRQGQTGICSSPAVVGNRVYFSGLNGKVYCLDATTLALVWVTDLRHTDLAHNQPVDHGTALSNGWSSPLVVNDRVYIGFGEGESNAFGFVYCLDANTGNVIWLFCTNLFPGVTDNSPNVIPPSSYSGVPPGPFTKAAANPPQRGSSPWSACAYDSVLNRIYIGTGNAIFDDPLPDPKYASGVLALDATTGNVMGFFQPAPSDSYRPPADLDVDVPAPPMLFTRAGTRVVAVGSKNGSFFLLDAANLNTVLAKRQLLPYDSAGNPFPAIDPPDTFDPFGNVILRENRYGVFGTAAVHYGLGRIFVGLGGYSGAIDSNTTPFMRVLDWVTLGDSWTTLGTNPPKYNVPVPPMYLTPNECGLSSPAVVNDVVFVSTTKPGLYALNAATGLCLWSAAGLGSASYAFGPAIYGDFVINGLSNGNLYIYTL